MNTFVLGSGQFWLLGIVVYRAGQKKRPDFEVGPVFLEEDGYEISLVVRAYIRRVNPAFQINSEIVI